MKFLRKFNEHASYEAEVNRLGVDIGLPNVSYCNDVKDVHYNPYNLIEFYVGEITGTTQQTVKIYTDLNTSVDIEVSKGNKWYSYLLPKDKGLYKIEGDSVKNVVVKANITTSGETIIPYSTVEASFKGSSTSKVTNMSYMFYRCSGLTSLDLSGFNTSNVTSMSGMFDYCSGLTSLDLSNFVTSNVTDMSYMFLQCSKLTSLDLSGWNASNVRNMNQMFQDCSCLTSLDLSGWNASNVRNMNQMFYYCIGLTSLDLSGWNTSNVTDMGSMFSGCSGLTSLDLSGWNTSNVTSMDSMFEGCSNSLTIRMKGCSSETVGKIRNQLTADGITGAAITTE